MIRLVGLLCYAFLALVVTRLVAGHLAWTWRIREFEHDRRHYPSLYANSLLASPNGEQWFGAGCVALVVAVAWPLFAVPWLVGRRVKVGAERDAAIRAREARVAQMEKELGLR